MRRYLTLALTLSITLHAHAAEVAGPRVLSGDGFEGAATLAEQKAASPELTRSRDAFSRSVRDMATWDFASVAQNSNWVAAGVVPFDMTFYARQQEPIGGPMSTDDRHYNVTLNRGAVNLLIPLGAAPKTASWVYQYEKMFLGLEVEMLKSETPDSFSNEAREAFSPFCEQPVDGTKRNLVLMSPPETIQTSELPRYISRVNLPESRPYFIAESSLKWVLPAQKFIKANPDLFSTQKAAANRKRLSELFDDPNPFLFAAAVRTLAQAGELDYIHITTWLTSADRFRQAVFIYSTLYYSPEASGKVLLDEMRQLLFLVRRKSQIDGMMIGADGAFRTWNNRVIIADPNQVFAPNQRTNLKPSASAPMPPSLVLYEPLIKELRDSLQRFGVTTEYDKYLMSLCYRSTLPPRVYMKPVTK